MTTPAPGKHTSEYKIALLSFVGSLATFGLKALGIAALATGQWWAVPASLAVTSLGYSLSRGLAKRGVTTIVTDGETPKSPGA